MDNGSLPQLSSLLCDNDYEHRVKKYFSHVSEVNLRSNIDEGLEGGGEEGRKSEFPLYSHIPETP